jgi:methanogenic corrinoid protein MtbC1
LGARRGVREIVAMAEQHAIEVLMISVLMLRAALQVAELRAGLDSGGLRTKLVVGGAPFRFDENLWREVGADYVGHNAADALGAVAEIGPGR